VIQDLVDLVRQNGARIASYLHDRKVVTMAASLPEKFHLLGDATVADVVVGTVDTILESIKYLPAIDLLVIDEAQHAPTPTYLKCINKSRAVNPALRILGATATPERPDFVGLECVFGAEVAAVITLKELIEGGWLVPPDVHRAQPRIFKVSVAKRA
jgi:superfamily II DNA or RNA helicase